MPRLLEMLPIKNYAMYGCKELWLSKVPKKKTSSVEDIPSTEGKARESW